MKSTSQAIAWQVPGKEEANPSREEERRENTKTQVGGRRAGQKRDEPPPSSPVKASNPETEPPPDFEQRFKQAVIDLGIDPHYADKTWSQAMSLSAADRAEFARKANVFLGWACLPRKVDKARVIFGEIAGLVNDRGAMRSRLSPQEKAARDIFREETGQDISSA